MSNNKVIQQVINRVATPIILNLLEPFTAEHVEQAVELNVDLVELMENNGDYRLEFVNFVKMLPGWEKVGNYLNKKWIDYFIDNVLSQKRKDLFVVFSYKRGAREWLYRNIRKLWETYFV